MRILAGGCTAIFLLTAASAAAQVQTGSGVVSLAATGTSENFDSLVSAGSGNALPTGWYFVERGSNANGSYSASDVSGSGSVSGDTYSLGTSGSSERAFGSVRSGSLTPAIGARVQNDTGTAIGGLALAYAGEQWRLGAPDRPAPDRLRFEYSLDAGSLHDGGATWVAVPALDVISPITAGPARGLDGNAAANRVLINGEFDGITLAAGASLWRRWSDVEIAGADDALGIDDFSLAFAGGPPVDHPPVVTSTIPADGATQVALGSSLTVVFSEPVATLDPWYTLTCNSQSVATTFGGGPVSYSIVPSGDLPEAQACILTILAAAVTDLDGDPDPLPENVEVAFASFDPALVPAPQIVSVQPGDGAVQVPVAATIRVEFDQVVLVDTNALTLDCDSEPVPGDLVAGGNVWWLEPVALLPHGADCRLQISAAGVVNEFGHPLPADAQFAFTVATESGSSYYAQVNTSSPAQLRCTLHRTIRGHIAYPYSGAGTNTWTILEIAQEDPADPERMIDSYRNRSYLKFTDRVGQGGSGLKYNREHTWPNSLGFPGQTDGQGNPNSPFTDVHMLHLTDESHNSARGNRPLANCMQASGCTELVTENNGGVGGGSGVYSGQSNWVRSPNGNQGSFEVWDHRKGDIARAVMYMAIRYEGGSHPDTSQVEPDLRLTDDRGQIQATSSSPAYMGLLSDLIAWHQNDPPSDEERARNEIIYSFQGNRNPFVDHPEWGTATLFTTPPAEPCILLDPDLIFADGFDETELTRAR